MRGVKRLKNLSLFEFVSQGVERGRKAFGVSAGALRHVWLTATLAVDVAGEQLNQVASLDAALDGGLGDAGDKRQLAALILGGEDNHAWLVAEAVLQVGGHGAQVASADVVRQTGCHDAKAVDFDGGVDHLSGLRHQLGLVQVLDLLLSSLEALGQLRDALWKVLGLDLQLAGNTLHECGFL